MMVREHGGEIVLLAPGWTSLIVVWRVVASKRISPQCIQRQPESPAWSE